MIPSSPADSRSHSKHWLITGVGSGLGRALAESAYRHGHRVTGTVRSEASRLEISREFGDGIFLLNMDLSDERAGQDVVAEAESHNGAIDVLVNNAGYCLWGAVEATSRAEVLAQFETNVFGTLSLIQSVLPRMRARRGGHIITVSSVSGLVGWAGMGIYSATKFALEGICETLAQEVAPLGIKVILVEPGGMRTDFALRSLRESARVLEDYSETVGANRRILQNHGGHEPGDPAKAAQAILRIAEVPQPPLRLLLGEDAWVYVERKMRQQSSELKEWESWTKSVGFDPSG